MGQDQVNVRTGLDDQIIAAHHAGDDHTLADLYLALAKIKEQANDIDAACFFFTNAYVFALASGNDEAASNAHNRLVSHEREK